MKNNMFKTMKSKVSDVCRKVLIPAFAGAVGIIIFAKNVVNDGDKM